MENIKKLKLKKMETKTTVYIAEKHVKQKLTYGKKGEVRASTRLIQKKKEQQVFSLIPCAQRRNATKITRSEEKEGKKYLF